MFGLDEMIARLGGGSVALAFVAALFLGLRHATDPDHLTAVSTLVLGEERHGSRRAGLLGLSWGLGHATTLFVFGLPVVLLGRHLPQVVQRAAEVSIGLVIVTLAVRLLVRWRRGVYHVHPHAHGERWHSHPHAHERQHAADALHRHPHVEGLGRSPLASYGIGLVHGVGGSAGASVLLVAAVPDPARAAVALGIFAAGTAVSMALVSMAFGSALTRGAVARRLVRLIPAFGLASLAFGAWYALAAL